MKHRTVFLLLGLALALGSLVSCGGFKGNAKRHSSAHYAVFFVDDSTSQYFIKPLTFQAAGTIAADVTFRKVHHTFSPVVLNFSLVTTEPRELRSIGLRADTEDISPTELQRMFREKQKQKYIQRYSLRLSYAELKRFFGAGALQILIDEVPFAPTRKSATTMQRLHRDFFGFVLSGHE